VDRFVEVCRLRIGLDAQLFLQQADALFVLAHGGRPLPGPGVQFHHLPVSRLVQRIQRQPATAVFDRLVIRSLEHVVVDEKLQGPAQRLAQPLGLEKLPLVKFGAVGQREACHKIVAIEGYPLRQCLGTRLAKAAVVAVMFLGLFQVVAEGSDVAPETALGINARLGAVGFQDLVADGAFHAGEFPAEVGAGS